MDVVEIYIEQNAIQYSGSGDSNGRIGVTTSLSFLSVIIMGLLLGGGFKKINFSNSHKNQFMQLTNSLNLKN